jgi:thiosulfate/3-mercaptopyruvate sulfurtransferase
MAFTTIISPAQLTQLIQTSNPLIIDTRHNLAEPNAGKNAYLINHISEAFFLHLDLDLSSEKTGTNGRHPLPEFNVLINKLNQIGLTNERQVVVYDDSFGIMAARLWWLLRYMGHKNVAVLEGGFSAYTALKLPCDASIPPKKPTNLGTFEASFNHEMLVDIAWIESHLNDPNIQLIDARSEPRFKGLEEPIDPIAGHIPGAINRFSMLNHADNHLFKSSQKLQDEWNTFLECSSGKTLVHTCGSGITACHNILACEIANIHNTKLYAGSWSEYCSNPTRKIATA